jgi:hypothetical protein
MGLPSYLNGGMADEIITVYYAGTDQLLEGYALCWDVSGATVSATDIKTRLMNQVVKPATANLMAFAGLLAATSSGKTGPTFIDLVPQKRNRFARAYTKINGTAFSTLLGPVNAQYELGAFADATVNLAFVGICAETVDTSGTSALKYILFK